MAKQWAGADLAKIVTNELLVRLADARNKASKTANLLMLIAAASAALYFLKLEGLAQELKVGDYTLENLPFGLFITCAISLIMSTVSLIRIGDAKEAEPRTVMNLSRYLTKYAERTGETVNIRYRPVRHIDGRLKRLIVFDCVDIRDAA